MRYIFIITSVALMLASPIGNALAQAPSNLTAQCGTGGTSATINWTAVPGAVAYAPRLNNTSNDSASCAFGWACGTGGDWYVDSYTSTSVVRSVVPGQPYSFWVHSLVNGNWSAPSSTNFTCASTTFPVPVGEIYDFLIQDVCVVNGLVTSTDPRLCQGVTRNLNVDEVLPYRRVTDHVPNVPFGMVEISDSFPARGPQNQFRVVHTFNIATPWDPNNFRSFLDFDTPSYSQLFATPIFPNSYAPHSDGYEVTEFDGNWVSLMGTRDANGMKPFFNATCGQDDTWISFPKNLPALGQGGYVLARLSYLTLPFEPRTATSFSCGGTPSLGDAGTYYLRGNWTFNNNIVLETIVTSHYDTADANTATAMERIFYTKPYGRTRWETWHRIDSTNPVADTSCSGPVEDIGYRRTVCREFTKVVADPVGGFDPRTWPVAYYAAKGNLLFNHSFTYDNLDRWIQTGSMTATKETESWAADDLRNGNRYGKFVNTNGSSIYQDVNKPSVATTGQTVGYGVRAWTTNGNAAVIHVGVWQLKSSGNTFHSQSITLDGNRKLIQGQFNLAADTYAFRFQIYFNGNAVPVGIDDAWITPLQ
jgi:hypothetical protein